MCYIDILYTCSKIIIYYHTWNYLLTKHKHYDFFHAPDQTIKVYYLLKHMEQHTIST